MNRNVVRLAVEMTVNAGQLEAFKAVARTMTEKTDSEPGTLGYEWFSSADGSRWRLLETYVDANAVLAHFTGPVVRDLVPQLAAVCMIDRFEIYGDPGPQVTEMAAGLGSHVFSYWAGLSR
jgi:quinol monooxygenase YgiN